MRTRCWSLVGGFLFISTLTFVGTAASNEILIGATTVNVTPDRPVALWGQMSTRISQGVESPVTATILVFESRHEGQIVDQSIMVACDLVVIPDVILERTRQSVAAKSADFPVKKIFLSATHTHTGPVMTAGIYEIPAEGVMQPAEYVEFFAERVADAILSAWKSRLPGKVGWGLGHAVIAQNRRVVFDDGTAAMYGRTDVANFRMFEGYEDHGVDVLCCWDAEDKLIATAINVACPAQEVEGRSYINADFWHEVRQTLRADQGVQLHVLAWTGAAGDQSPHPMFRKQAEERMLKLRGLNRLQELSRRIVSAWKEAYDGARQDMRADVPLVHRMEVLNLPRRPVSEREWLLAKAKVAEYSSQKDKQTLIHWHQGVVDRYARQQSGSVVPYSMELHTVRVGDIAITTNPFELYTDFGIQIKARVPALQTFVIQLTGPGTYLPSLRAVGGGGYTRDR